MTSVRHDLVQVLAHAPFLECAVVNLRRPSPYSRCLLLLALLLGLLAPAATLALAKGEPLVGVCRSPAAQGQTDAAPHGWFDHCAACGALGQSLGELPVQMPLRALAAQQIATIAVEPAAAPRTRGCAPPPPRGPPTQH